MASLLGYRSLKIYTENSKQNSHSDVLDALRCSLITGILSNFQASNLDSTAKSTVEVARDLLKSPTE